MRRATGRSATCVLLLSSFSLLIGACVGEVSGGEGERGVAGAGFSDSFRDLFSNMRKVDLGDLVALGARLGTDQVNQQLGAGPYLGIQLRPTELYALSDRAKYDLTLKDLQAMTAGLAQRYGDSEFITHVNQLRTAHLQATPDRLWAESQFKIDPKLAPQFNFNAGNLPVNVGFVLHKEIASTVVAPYRGFGSEGRLPELDAVLSGPVNAFLQMRGFLMPRDVDDIVAMTPGESWTRSGQGAVGFNVGIGVPFYLTSLGSFATVHLVTSIGGHAVVGGTVDIQLVRDERQSAVVDVGVSDVTDWGVRAALETRYGVEALPEFKLKVGSVELNASDLAQKALEDLMNRKLSPFSAAASYGEKTMRHTVARFSFDLSRRSVELDQAITQALLGHLELAQALANRPGSGVVQLLDLTRDARSTASYIGARFLSMSFFSQKQTNVGDVVVTTGAESQRLLFDELDKQSGLFFTTRGFHRSTVVSLRSRDGQLVDADFNLRLQLREGDTYTERDQILDHVDPLLAAFVRKDRVARISAVTDPLQQLVDTTCKPPVRSSNPKGVDTQYAVQAQAYRKCLATLPSVSYIVDQRTQAETTFGSILAEGVQDGLDPAFDDGAKIARQLFELKLAVQSSYEYPALWTGPKSTMVVDLRLTERALDALLAAADGEARFEQALRDALALLHVQHDRASSTQGTKLAEKLASLSGAIERARGRLANSAAQYQQLSGLAGLGHSSAALGQTTLGGQAHLLVAGEDGQTTLAVIAERKATTAAKLFDTLVSDGGYGSPAHQAIGYAFLLGTSPAQVELLVNLDFRKTDEADYPDLRLHGRGAGAKLIDAGKYSLEALIGN